MDPTTAAVRFLMQRVVDEEEAKIAGKRFENVDAQVEWGGTRIVLPDSPLRMNMEEAKEWLTRLEHADNEVIQVNEVIDAFLFDGAIAMMKALKRIYGWANPVPPRSFFEAPPTMMSVEISPTRRTQIIWGRFQIPGIDGTLTTGVDDKLGRPVFCIQGEVRKKYLPAIAEIAELTRRFVATESIYRGHPVRLHTMPTGALNLKVPPNFIDVAEAHPEELIFSDALMEQITTNLFTPIVHADVCRENKIPLKRGILMEGAFGTGKTLCAYMTARIAEDHGWTFIMIDRVSSLTAALNFGVLYQPCVIFCEDIDRETTGPRTEALDAILNVIDGIASKGKEIMVVLTSNYAEKINQAMMRPGRLDAVLSIQPPDAIAAERLMRLYGRGLIAADEALTESASVLQGQIPAVIRECVERSKLYAISRNGLSDGLRDTDLVRAARGMQHHLELLHGQPFVDQSLEYQLGAAMMTAIGQSMQSATGLDDTNSAIDAVGNVVQSTHNMVAEIDRRMRHR